MKLSHFIGGILLVSGTTIGAGMLALPVMTSFMGFFPSILLFILIWIYMLFTALFFLDVNLSFKGEANMISMAGKTLGLWGKVVAWVTYLLLLYSLVAAYVAGSAPLFGAAFESIFGVGISERITPLFLPVLFGVFIYIGTLGVDLVNRLLMFGLVVAYIFLIFVIPSHIEGELLMHVDFSPTLFAIPVVLTSFGYHIIIPTLTEYLHHDKSHLKKTIIFGSILPLVVYILWQFLILGTVPIEGKYSLMSAWKQGVSATIPLAQVIKNSWITVPARFFSFFAIVTSFLGVSLSLSDFLIDGFNLSRKRWEGRSLACLLTFIPPLIFIYTFPRGFILALEYAGAFVAILLAFLPAAMAWKLKTPKFYQSMRGKALLLTVMTIAVLIVIVDVMLQWGYFKDFLSNYV